MEASKKQQISHAVKTMLIAFGCVLLNLFGKYAAEALRLPLWLDCIGTAFAAYVLGPISGALVGITVNTVYGLWDVNALLYSLTSAVVGMLLGAAARKKRLETFSGAMQAAGGVAIIAALLSTVLNLLFCGGQSGNLWGDGVRAFLLEKGVPDAPASAVGELYVDFLDKLLTVLLLYVSVKLFRRLRKRLNKARGAAGVLLACLLLSGALALPAEAYVGNADGAASYIQQVYDAENGLSCGQVNDVAQSSNGILWVGADSGLYRYNGSSFRFMDSFDAVKNVNCLYVDQEGRLWIGTKDNGLVLAINEKIANTLDVDSGLPSDSVTGVVQSAGGEYYVCTAGQMAVVSITIGIAVTETIEEVRGARCVSADAEGNVAAVTGDGGLCVLNGRELRCAVAAPDGGAVYSACAFDENGLLYGGTTDGRIHAFRIIGDRAVETGSIRCEGAGRINQICFHAGHEWILSDGGIGILDRNAYQRLDTGDFDSSVERMTVDYQGNFWFTSAKHGLLQLSETMFSNLNAAFGLPAEAVNTTCVRDGVLYIGSDSGLTAVMLANGNPVGNTLTEYLSGTPVNSLRTAVGGDLLVCSGGKGLLRYSADGALSGAGLGGTVYLCEPLPDGGLAAVSDGGLTLIGGGRTVTIPYGGALGSSRILTVCGLPDGSILAGTDGSGIAVIRDGAVAGHLRKEDGLSSETVRRIVPDGCGDGCYIVTGSGLCYLEDDAVTQLSAFPYSDNYDVVTDGDKEVFVLGSAGVYVVNRDALLYGEDEDLEYTLLDARAGFIGTLTKNARNGHRGKNLFLSTDRGVVRMNLDAYKSEKRSYRLMVSAIKLDGKTFPIERGSGLTIGRDVQSIEFIPEIVNYFRDNPNVSYYLEGADSGYKTVAQSDLSGVVFTNLPSGEYTFHLAILDEKSGNVREESTYGFIKEKSIYDNGWFLIYMLVVGGLFIGWLAWFLTKYRAQRALAIEQEKLALALKQVQMGNETILAIAKTVDAKDAMTSRHSQRVSEYSVLIAGKLGFSAQEQENLRKAALLHDIGKIGIPDSILNKPDRLTDQEYAVMQTHVTRGAEILKDFTLIEHVVEGARYHHERYDGRGYPDRLKGTDIPLYGRIIAIADAFDAMTANRVYRKRQDFSYVLGELHKGRGTQFDPELLDVFLGLIDSGEIDADALYAGPSEKAGEEENDG